MRYRVFHRGILVALGVLSVGLLGWPARTRAQTLGDITGTVGTVTGIVGGTTTVLGGTGTLAAGSVDALYSEADSISTSLVSAQVPAARVIGYLDEIASESYLASLNLIIAGISIAADSAEAEARAPLNGSSNTGTSYISNLSINGVDVPVDGTVNQTVSIPGGQLVINEQQVLSDGTLVVNALHATVYGVADVVVASATAGASGGDAKAVQATTF
ncbi:MAG: hypothetical protein AUH29_16290 [Candidatus Rokubacteria bacterium 13_1_40CM_69_27]|nr:MAG: hypothetical protein AUH29_16290 [Candidatus Rokubacteria bacterium 13_1_40CM_69_27]